MFKVRKSRILSNTTQAFVNKIMITEKKVERNKIWVKSHIRTMTIIKKLSRFIPKAIECLFLKKNSWDKFGLLQKKSRKAPDLSRNFWNVKNCQKSGPALNKVNNYRPSQRQFHQHFGSGWNTRNVKLEKFTKQNPGITGTCLRKRRKCVLGNLRTNIELLNVELSNSRKL